LLGYRTGWLAQFYRIDYGYFWHGYYTQITEAHDNWLASRNNATFTYITPKIDYTRPYYPSADFPLQLAAVFTAYFYVDTRGWYNFSLTSAYGALLYLTDGTGSRQVK
jgi:hypothetical protein